MARPWAADVRQRLKPAGLFLGNGAPAIEVAVARCGSVPTRTALLETWKRRRGGRAGPVLLVVLHPEGAALCGASGEEPPAYPRADVGQVERLCREVLGQPDRHSALRFLAQVLPSLETALPGLNNEGLLAMHELEHGAPTRADWGAARRKATAAVGRRDESLLTALGFQVERLDNLTSLLRGGDQRIALAVMLRETESPEAGTERFNSLSPVSYALAKADSENLSWVVLVQGTRLRLYSTDVDAGVGRRGRTETFIECQPSLLSDQHLPYLWLLYSAEALAPDGSLREVLTDSHRFAGNLAERLRERIYDKVVPVLAQGMAASRNVAKPGPVDRERTYEMALTVLFRVLFIAYAEDRDLLPYRFNDSYRRRSLKQKAQELADCVAREVPIADGTSHWQETSLLWEAVASGNREWSVPAYDGGLFTSDPRVSPAGAALTGVVLPNATFEAVLRALLVIETAEGVPGPVDFRSLGVREFGTIYEGLLESELALADTDLALNQRRIEVDAAADGARLVLVLALVGTAGAAVELREHDLAYPASGAQADRQAVGVEQFQGYGAVETGVDPAGVLDEQADAPDRRPAAHPGARRGPYRSERHPCQLAAHQRQITQPVRSTARVASYDPASNRHFVRQGAERSEVGRHRGDSDHRGLGDR